MILKFFAISNHHFHFKNAQSLFLFLPSIYFENNNQKSYIHNSYLMFNILLCLGSVQWTNKFKSSPYNFILNSDSYYIIAFLVCVCMYLWLCVNKLFGAVSMIRIHVHTCKYIRIMLEHYLSIAFYNSNSVLAHHSIGYFFFI